MGFKNVKTVITISGWNKEEGGYSCKTAGGKSIIVRKSPKLKGTSMKYNVEIPVELGQKDGGPWFINAAQVPGGGEGESSGGGSKDGSKYDAAGQEKGNFRTNLTNVIISGFEADNILTFEAIKERIDRYLELLKYGEDLKSGSKPKEGEVSTPDEIPEDVTEEASAEDIF